MAGAYADKISSDGTLLEVEAKISGVMKDLTQRIQSVYDKYLNDDKTVPRLPAYAELVKSPKLYYETSLRLEYAMDELMQMKIRVGVVTREIRQISNMQFSVKSSDYVFIQNLKKKLESYLQDLDEYKFEITGVVSNMRSKLRTIESVSYLGE